MSAEVAGPNCGNYKSREAVLPEAPLPSVEKYEISIGRSRPGVVVSTRRSKVFLVIFGWCKGR